MLAEFFEEEFHERAPTRTLGQLALDIRESLRERGNEHLITKIRASVSSVNVSRITAVHRGAVEVSEREAMGALEGAARVVIWYHFFRT